MTTTKKQISRTNQVKSFQIAIGAARKEGRAPSHDGEYISIYYQPSDPTSLLAENNGGAFDIDDMRHEPEYDFYGDEAEALAAADLEIHIEAYQRAAAGNGEPATDGGFDAIDTMRRMGWLEIWMIDGTHIDQAATAETAI